MSARRVDHDKFRDLYKGVVRDPNQPQTTVTIQTRARPTAAPGESNSNKSVKKKTSSSKRAKPSSKKVSGSRTKATNALVSTKTPTDASNKSNRKTKAAPAQQPKTPPNQQGSRGRAPSAKTPVSGGKSQDTPEKPLDKPKIGTAGAKINGQDTPEKNAEGPKIPAPDAKFNGQEIQEKTQMCLTVFENDAGGGTTAGGTTTEGGGPIHLAQSRIKERKLQWMPSEKENSNDKSPDDLKNLDMKDVVQATRTLFENNNGQQAACKVDNDKLQWAPPADMIARECVSEPEVRKKKSNDNVVRAVSDRPPKDQPPVKPPRQFHVVKPRTPEKAVDPTSAIGSPSTRPVMLAPAEGTAFKADAAGAEAFGSGAKSPEKEARPASCYLAPNMQ